MRHFHQTPTDIKGTLVVMTRALLCYQNAGSEPDMVDIARAVTKCWKIVVDPFQQQNMMDRGSTMRNDVILEVMRLYQEERPQSGRGPRSLDEIFREDSEVSARAPLKDID